MQIYKYNKIRLWGKESLKPNEKLFCDEGLPRLTVYLNVNKSVWENGFLNAYPLTICKLKYLGTKESWKPNKTKQKHFDPTGFAHNVVDL